MKWDLDAKDPLRLAARASQIGLIDIAPLHWTASDPSKVQLTPTSDGEQCVVTPLTSGMVTITLTGGGGILPATMTLQILLTNTPRLAIEFVSPTGQVAPLDVDRGLGGQWPAGGQPT